jgi:hypothetical protein
MQWRGRYEDGRQPPRGGACRGQPRGSPKKPGESCLKLAKNTKHKYSSNITRNIRTQHSPRRDGPRGPPERRNKPPPRARSASLEGSRPPRARSASLEGSRSLEWVPPRSRAHAPSSGFRLARGSPPPSSGLRLARGSLTSAPAPARGYEHLMLRHSRAAPSRAWESRPGAVPPTP